MAEEIGEAEAFAMRLLVSKYYADPGVWVPYGAKYGMPYDGFVALATGSSPEALQQHHPQGEPLHQQGPLEHFIIEYVKHAFPADRGGNPESPIALDVVEANLKGLLRDLIQTWQGVPDGTMQAGLFLEDLKSDLDTDIAAHLGRPFP